MSPTNLARWPAALLLTLLGTLAGPVQADASGAGLRREEGLVVLDHQSIRVPGDAPIDLAGFHIHQRVSERVYLGMGAYAPLFQGEYGGFMAFDVGVHLQQHLTPRLFATAGLAGGGGGGGRSAGHSRFLSGTGGFIKGYAGLGYTFTGYSLGAQVARMQFQDAAIRDTSANLFVQFPFGYLRGPFESHGQALTPMAQRLAEDEAGENMLGVVLDQIHQQDPQGSFKGTLGMVDLQYAHFMARDTYWFAALGVGHSGRPLYNQMLGGIGQRLRLSPRTSLYGQIGLGSGGYAPDVIDTGPGLLVYPKATAEVALSREFGLALSAGVLRAPRGSSRNIGYGLALNYHIRPADRDGAALPALFQGARWSLFQQTEFNVRYGGIDRAPLRLLAGQLDMALDDRWFIPLQAGVAYNAYLGYPGYGELLAGIGLQQRHEAGARGRFFGQLLGGTNPHGPAVKAAAGLHLDLGEPWSLTASAGKTRARHADGRRFSADSIGLGLGYRFSMPGR
ncbi:hypothetical protein [Leptothrix discophora]|uniref:Uncharacterized protein n=1 Tax=Leptothrix discophora TaxID=89 RepID=A0ABT9G3W5_LEPDI|nr:hypothetical protein [Leptothrix discophora]MDP4301110.1 hypothetical protein [Leptothrix discophora]